MVGPGTQVYQMGAKIRLQLNVQPGGDSPTLAVTGLSGLAIGADQVLSGTAPSATGVHRVTVTATDNGQTASASFDVVIVPKITASHPAAGEARLNGGSWCLTGAGYSRAAGTAAVLERCAGKAAQQWSLRPAGGVGGTGTVKIDGSCLTISSGSGNGAKASIRGCVDGLVPAGLDLSGQRPSAELGDRQVPGRARQRSRRAGGRHLVVQRWCVGRVGAARGTGTVRHLRPLPG